MSETTEAPATAIAIRPHAPIGSVSTLRGLLEPRMSALAAVLPSHVTPDRMLKTLLVAVNRTPQLLECTQESVLESISRGAELGLDLSGTLGEAYLVPFRNTIKIRQPGSTAMHAMSVLQCLMIPGYRGLVKLARQSGELKRIEADVVYEADTFEFERGLTPKCRHVPAIRQPERGEIIGAYMVAELLDGAVQIDFMTKAEIEKVRRSSKAADGPMWTQWWSEAAKKTVIRRGMKLLPMSSERLHRAIEAADSEFDIEAQAEVQTTKKPGSRADALAASLGVEIDLPASGYDPTGEDIGKLVEQEIGGAAAGREPGEDDGAPETGDALSTAEKTRLERLYFDLMPNKAEISADIFGEQFDLLIHDVTGGTPPTAKHAVVIEAEIRKRASEAGGKPKARK